MTYLLSDAVNATVVLIFDALDSTDRLLSVPQAVTDQYLYEAFGKEVLKTGTTRNPFRWLGQIGYYTETETAGGVPVYVRARQYSPVTGRWLSVDPVRQSFSLFLYVMNGPVRETDPNGLVFICGGLTGFTGLLLGVSGSAMYCKDNCGNSGIVVCAGGGLAQGLSLGIGVGVGQGCLPCNGTGQFNIQLSAAVGGSGTVGDDGLGGGVSVGVGGGGAITLELCKLL